MSNPPNAAQEPSRGEPAPARKSAIGPHQIIAAVLVVIFIVFLAKNTEKITVDVIFRNFRAPVWLELVAAAIVGSLITLLLLFRRSYRHR